MSRFGGDYRASAGNLPYRDEPVPRWDSARFSREREERIRSPPVMERERERESFDAYGRRGEDRYTVPPPPREVETRIDDRYFAEERYGPPARRTDRRYYEEDDFYERDTRGPPGGGAMIPYRPRRFEPPVAPIAPLAPVAPPRPRPGLLRRQSSLDTFDRRPVRRFNDFEPEEYKPPPPQPPVTYMPPPRRATPPRYGPKYGDRDREYREVDEIRIAEPDYYGDDDYRAYREREWTKSRARHRSSSTEFRVKEKEVEKEAEKESVKEFDRQSVKEEVFEEVVEEVVQEEKPYPRRGKTRMPKRLAHLGALSKLGYPYHEEDDMIIIEKALSKENIDEVVGMSREYKERDEIHTVHLIEAPPPPRTEKATTVAMSEAPRSVREWDVMRSTSPKSIRTARSRHASRSRRGSSPKEEILEVRKESMIIKEVSPARTARTSRTRRPSASPARTARTRHHSASPTRTARTRHHSASPARTARSRRQSTAAGTEIYERREVIEEEGYGPIGQSNSFHAGPLALISSPRRNEHDIKAEIRALEDERKSLKVERRDRDRRKSAYYREGDRELIFERPAEEVVEVRKDRKGRMSLVVK